MMANNVGAYTGDDSLLFEMVKYQGTLYFMINGNVVGSKAFEGFEESVKVGVALTTFEIQATFTEYEATADDSIVATHVPS